jgi:hypothetical protein
MLKKAIIVVCLGMLLVPATGSTAWAYRNERSNRDKAILIGGSAAAGAVLGGLLGGGKGAVAGAIAGGAGSAIYDRATQDRGYRTERTTREKAILIGGSAGAGAVSGAIAGGKTGALIGAAIGGVGGYILHKKTEDRDDEAYRYWRR